MKPFDIQPILNEPALYIKEKKTLVIADLHIGIERELRESGLQIASQTKAMTTRLLAIIKKNHPKEIILLGDIKHNIPTSTIQERTDVKEFFATIQSYGAIHVIPGNHDGNIKKLLPPNTILHRSDGCVLDNVGYIHGHRWPAKEIMECNCIIVGHTHPTIMLSDRLGYQTYELCWLRGSITDSIREKYQLIENPSIIMMPPFNPLCGGIAVNSEPIIGPFNKILDVKKAHVYLLDGSSLGRVQDINKTR